jgi:hypothetical protein
MTEDGFSATGEHCGHPAASKSRGSVPNRVDPWPQASQPPPAQPYFDRLSTQAKSLELTPRHHPVLSLCQLGDPNIHSTSLL